MTRNNLNWSLEYYEEHLEECDSIINSLEDYDKIPMIDPVSLQTLTDGTLVRYRGMVQDMLNPEYYYSSFTVVNEENNETYVKSGKFRDVASCKINEKFNLKGPDFLPKERLVFYCISVPGTNNWVQDCQAEQSSVKQGASHHMTSGLKRSANELVSDNAEMGIDGSESVSETAEKKSRAKEIGSAKSEKSNSQSDVYDQQRYLPIASANRGLPCIVKVYEEEEKCGLILNDRIEVIGFLSLNPALGADSEEQDVGDKALNPPPSLVPRVHALQIRKLKHNNPLLKQIISNEEIEQLSESARKDLHLILSQLLFEDALAADYMICHLISGIYIRDESNTIGKFSLNIFNISSKSFASTFYDILKTLVTNSHYVPLTTSLLNARTFVPRKDYESNRLCSGMLQLCDDVHLVLDETKMNEGQLNNTGCLNVSALQRLLRDQEIQYDFGYYPVKYETNIPVLVISEGKSMFEADIRLKVISEPSSEFSLNESVEAVKLYLKDEVMSKIRIYLSAVKLLDFELGEEMTGRIGQDYVSLRRENRDVGSSDLHTLLVLSRLLALSRGRTVLGAEDWTQALEMETERRWRLK